MYSISLIVSESLDFLFWFLKESDFFDNIDELSEHIDDNPDEISEDSNEILENSDETTSSFRSFIYIRVPFETL